MAIHKRTGIALAVGIAASALIACSDQASLAPVLAPGNDSDPEQVSRPTPGSYELSFLSGGQEVSTLPICTESACEELALKATDEDAIGAPAQSGAVVFQYCSYKGLPPNDIERADEAPKEACESGEGTWQNLTTVKVILVNGVPEIPLAGFGAVRNPRTVGFRFRYMGQGSGIANGSSEPENFTWTNP